MAFARRWGRRVSARRRYAGTRGRYRRSSRNFRSGRHGFGKVNVRQKRLPRRQARKRFIKRVASKKKWDTMKSVRDLNDPPDGFSDILLQTATSVFLFCPNFRNLDRDVSNDHTRNTSDIFFRGFAEKFWVQTGPVPLVHRRICFWAQITPAAARPLIQPATNSPPTYSRPFTEIQDDSVLMEYLFQGNAGVDYAATTWPGSKLDRRRCRIISDTTKITNPGNDTATQKLYSTWCGVNRNMRYADEELGSGEISEPWAAPSPYNPGNLFIMDIFTQGFQNPPAGEGARFTTQSTVYWHEP